MAANQDKDRVSPGPESAERPGDGEKIVWQASDVRVVRADMTDVVGTQEEIAITFGTARPLGGEEGIVVDLFDRILLSPFTAKRLAIILGMAMEKHEKMYGADQAAPVAGSDAPLASSVRIPAFRSVDSLKDEKLFRLVKGLGAPFGFERSFKVLEKTLLANRFLLSVARDTVEGDPMTRVSNLCRQTDMPGELLASVERHFPAAEILHFGFEESERGSVYKVYLEFAGKDRIDPFLVHLAFKWDPANPSRYAVARYTRFPFIPLDRIVDRVSVILDGPRHGESLQMAKSILGMAPFRSIDDMHYLEVEEEGNPRKSFDINAYKAHLHLEELAPVLTDLARRYSIPQQKFQDLMGDISGKIFGHLSGGIDRSGRDFFTIHYGVEAC